MSIPSLIVRESMSIPSLLTGIQIKENNIPTIQAWESMDFPWNVPRATPSGHSSENPYSPSLGWQVCYILSCILNITTAGPCHLYIDTPILTLPSTRILAILPKLLCWCHDGGRCLWVVRNTIGRGVCRKNIAISSATYLQKFYIQSILQGALSLPCHPYQRLESSLFSLPLYVSLYMRQTSI